MSVHIIKRQLYELTLRSPVGDAVDLTVEDILAVAQLAASRAWGLAGGTLQGYGWNVGKTHLQGGFAGRVDLGGCLPRPPPTDPGLHITRTRFLIS